MQAGTLAQWINVLINLGLLIVAVLALKKWSQYLNTKSNETRPGSMAIGESYDSTVLQDKSAVSSQLTFDTILRNENKLEIVDVQADKKSVEEGDDISEEEFYGAVMTQKTEIPFK